MMLLVSSSLHWDPGLPILVGIPSYHCYYTSFLGLGKRVEGD